MSYQFYSLLHLSSIVALALLLGALWGISTHKETAKKLRSVLLSLHGLILFLILLAGFALIAKTGLSWPWPLWLYVKLLVWLFMGFAPVLIKKSGTKFLTSKKHFFVLVLCFVVLLTAIMVVNLK